MAVYKKEYGTEKQQKLANETGFSKSTLYKCRQFALKFWTEQMDELFQDKFTLPWRVVASNLSLGPDDFIKQYRAANTLDNCGTRYTIQKNQKVLHKRRSLARKKRFQEVS